MSLRAHVQIALGTLALDASLTAADGETVAILGPNGAGKTTLLRGLAGLVPLDAGAITIDGTPLDDGRQVFVPPERRPIGVVFQDYLLFPHLTVLENVAFGLRSCGVGRAEARAAAMSALERVGLGDRGSVKPQELSGGQAQRVALVRALVTEPRLLLLDEPLAALDQTTRASVRRDLRAQLGAFGGVRILVTHDPRDAAALADRLVILEGGRVVQSGTFADVSAHPRSDYVADLVGMNLLRGTAHGDRVELANGGTLIAADAGTGEVFAVVHPRSVALHRDHPTGSPRNVLAGTVETIDATGDRVRVGVGGAVPLVAEITPASLQELRLSDGTEVWVSVKATDITVFRS
ncbi:MAG: ABC transporter ATP-binding protein [Acidimicrobiia bacterium]